MFGRKPGKNKLMNQRIDVVEMDMANNYKDAAQLSFKRAKATYQELVDAGKLSAKEQVHYTEVLEKYERQLRHFWHAEGPGTGRYQGVDD